MTKELVPLTPLNSSLARKLTDSNLPAAIKAAGHASAFAYEEFLFGQIRNKHTRRAYTHAVHHFLAWVDQNQASLPQISPKDVSDYFETLALAIPSKKPGRWGRHPASLARSTCSVLPPIFSACSAGHQLQRQMQCPGTRAPDARTPVLPTGGVRSIVEAMLTGSSLSAEMGPAHRSSIPSLDLTSCPMRADQRAQPRRKGYVHGITRAAHAAASRRS